MSDSYIKTFACKHLTFSAKNFNFFLYHNHNHNNFIELLPFANIYLNVNSIVSGYFNFYTVFKQANTQTNVINRVS